MAMPHAQLLLEKAQSGEKLSTADRRHVVAFLMSGGGNGSGGPPTNVEMAKWFKITERAVRMDKKYIREEMAQTIKEEDVGLVIADIALSYDLQIRRLEKALISKECKEGTRTYLEYVKTIFNMQLEKVTALQRLGYYPQSLGNAALDRFDFKATVALDGSVESHRKKLTPKNKKDLEVLEAEFMDVPRITDGTK